jgi:oligoendopeptidase F
MAGWAYVSCGMSLLPFGDLAPFKARQFVPGKIDLGDWGQIAPLFDQLESKGASCKTAGELERWLVDCSELTAALDEELSRRNIAMTCHTDSAEAEKAYLHFVEHIDPQIKPRQFKLAEIFLAHPMRAQLAKERYFVFDRSTKVLVELYRPENVPLETEEAKLGQQFQKLSGSLTVQFRGEEKTLIQMGRYLEEPDRNLRKEAWELVANRRLQEAEHFENIFEGLLQLREKIAVNAGFPNYRDYAFRLNRRFDYTPEDCRKFHDAIESEVMPILRQLQEQRRRQLGVESLRPWDVSVDPLNRAPLRPFERIDGLVSGCQRIFDKLDSSLAEEFRLMEKLRLLDLDNRKGKAPGGYQSTLAESRLPFIFANSVGIQRDVETILHEAGHAFHALESREDDLHAYRSAPIEFCEVASMAMELLGAEHIDVFYSPDDSRRARRDHLEGIVKVFPWIATVDAFQHWIYSHPGHARAERQKAWVDLMKRFGGDVDWSGYENVRANLWHRQLHIFLYPFYYVEYGIAQLGALQVWAASKRDKNKALANYHRGLALGGSRPLPELFEAAGCTFDFSAQTVRPLSQLVRTELEKLDRRPAGNS